MLDQKDEMIVAELQADAWLSYVQLGGRINLSPSATQRRVERLKRQGIIQGANAVIAPEVSQRNLRIYMFLDLENDNAEALADLQQDLRKFPGFVEACVTIGATDVVVTLDCLNIEEYQAWSMSTINDNLNIRHCTTMINLKRL